MLNRREFVSASAVASLAPVPQQSSLHRHVKTNPLAITMWDFSWLERRWPGAGYEDWDEALGELKKRGYNAVRIDAYPHLVHAAPEKTWQLLPVWYFQDWGAAALCRVQVQPNLNTFISKCRDHGIAVGLSTWFRQDTDDTRMKIKTPADLAAIWKSTLDSISKAGLLDQILYVDLCNEWPLDVWAPFAPKGLNRTSTAGVQWMREPIEALRKSYPSLDYTFSFTSEYDNYQKQDVSMLDFMELHLWMTHFSDFYKKVGYNYERFDQKGYENLQLKGESTYRADPAHWQERLVYGVDYIAGWSKFAKKPLITTECWSLVDYRDWPMLPWGYLKELCEIGVNRACSHGQWVAIATSNFCGPQFKGMWRDVEWHQKLTEKIRGAKLPQGWGA
jgi:hypothetical protein